MSSKDFGLGPKWWQKPANKLKKCSERKSDWCDPTETDGCCAVIPCVYCLELEIYGESLQYGEANFAETGWSGTVGGGSFFGFWEVGQYSGQCEFVVLWNGEEVYRKGCPDGQSCRDSSDEVGVVSNYEDATLRWIKHEFRPLAYIKEPETNCTVHFCDDCECSSECLCVTITEPNSTISAGEICDIAYPCDAPVWAGRVGDFDLSIALGRNQYGQCIITATVDGEEQEPVLFSGCSDASATITLYDGTIIFVSTKKCSCDEPLESCCGCPTFGGNDGCIVFSVKDDCISSDRFDLNWSVGRGGMPASPTVWGTVTCEMFATINMGASIPGCGGADIDFTFVIFRVTDPDPSVASIISDCEWAMEVYADGVYLAMYLEYTNECQVTGVDDPLAWIQFPNVDIGGLGTSTVTSDFTIPNTKC